MKRRPGRSWAPTSSTSGRRKALLANDEGVFFTTPHFDGYAAILVRLHRITLEALEELVVEAWLTRAPRRLTRAYLDSL